MQNDRKPKAPGKKQPKISTPMKIFAAMILGVLTGMLFGESTACLQVVGDLFIRMINMTVVPVVFVSLVCGVISMKDPVKMGRIASRTLMIYACTMGIATGLSLFLAGLFAPGKGLSIKALTDGVATVQPEQTDFIQTLIAIIPSNIVRAFKDGNILQIIVVALLTGVSVNFAGNKAKPVENLFNSLQQVIFRFVRIIMGFAPVGIFALMAVVAGAHGPDVLSSLAAVVGIIYLAMILVIVVIYGLGLGVYARLNPFYFFKKMLEVQTVAFTSTSSAASLPVNLQVAREKLGISQSITGFVLPLGATVNMNGLSAYMGVIAVFSANLYGIDLSISDMMTVVLTSTIAAIGCAGVPAAGLIVMPMVLGSIGVPVKVVGILAAIDRIVDMMSTTTNITGDTFAAVVVAKAENELDTNTYYRDYYPGAFSSAAAESSAISGR